MKIYTTAHFERKYKKLIKKNPRLSSQIDKKVSLVQKNLSHPSLRLHKLSGKKIETWSFSIETNLRIIFKKVKGGILMIDIGSHDEVY